MTLSSRRTAPLFVLLILACVASATPAPQSTPTRASASYIVQASNADVAAAAAERAGGTVTQRLPIINGVAATLSAAGHAQLERTTGIALHNDSKVQRSDTGPGNETDTKDALLYPAAATTADLLHERKVTSPKTECKDQRVTVSQREREERLHRGWGVTVAVIDSGFMRMASPGDWTYQDAASGTLIAENSGRCLVYRDFLARSAAHDNLRNRDGSYNSTDQHGHGTHIAATIGDQRETQQRQGENATPIGIAPDANLVMARALDKDGMGTYADVIASLDWIVQNRARYNIRVLNLSIQSEVVSPYWADPLNQAVMQAWKSGIVVVAAAGNYGPAAGTITAPGNVPYIITVGAIKSGRYTDSGYDELATYSGRGPTESAFVKPDMVVPGSRTIAPMPKQSSLGVQFDAGRIQTDDDVDFKVGAPAEDHAYFQLSGTSMAAAEVSGLVALLLQNEPGLTPDQVKYRLMATARPAMDRAGQSVYSPWEQGAGLVDITAAIAATTTEHANAGMDIGGDLTTDTHYWGHTEWDEASQTFRVADPLTGETQATWTGAGRSWAGSEWVWTGAGRSWAGAGRSWAGAGRSWAGSTWAYSESFWAGAGRSWAGSLATSSNQSGLRGDLLVTDKARTFVPMIGR